tara:strand:- start:2134 stop:2283 length:150 start_codon:yes stop_codon:yes gene_type:complete
VKVTNIIPLICFSHSAVAKGMYKPVIASAIGVALLYEINALFPYGAFLH